MKVRDAADSQQLLEVGEDRPHQGVRHLLPPVYSLLVKLVSIRIILWSLVSFRSSIGWSGSGRRSKSLVLITDLLKTGQSKQAKRSREAVQETPYGDESVDLPSGKRRRRTWDSLAISLRLLSTIPGFVPAPMHYLIGGDDIQH